jgi:hypothetical protein
MRPPVPAPPAASRQEQPRSTAPSGTSTDFELNGPLTTMEVPVAPLPMTVPPPLPGQLNPTDNDVYTDVSPVNEEIPYLEPVTEREDDIITLYPAEGEAILDVLPADGTAETARRKLKRPRRPPPTPSRDWRVRYGLVEDPDNPDRGTVFWSPARIGGLTSIGLSFALFVVWFLLLDQWDSQMTMGRATVLWALFGGVFGVSLMISIVVSVLLWVPLIYFNERWEIVTGLLSKVVLWLVLGGALGSLISGAYYFIRGHD